MAGPSSSNSGRRRRKAIIRGLIAETKNVSIVNRWVDDAEVPAIFRAADIVMIPYTSASQSGVIALAATFGCPVIATRVGGLPEQIRDGETGVLVEPSAEAMASAVDRLLTDHEFREKLAHKLALEMRTKFDWTTTSNAYLQSCRKAMRGRSSGDESGSIPSYMVVSSFCCKCSIAHNRAG